jgi:hypothetical protein
MSATNQPSRLFVSSSNSEYGQAGYLINITLPEAILDAKGVECSRATIPNSLYPIPDYQNTFYFRWSNGSGNAPVKSLVLTNRRYFANPDELVAQLNLDAVAQNLGIVFTYDNITKRISVTATDPANHQVLVCPESHWLSEFALNTRLGFTDRQNVFAASWTAPLLPNLIRTKVIYICSNICIDDTLNANGALRNIIAKIPNNAFFGGLNIYEPIFPQYGRIVSSTIQRIQITLLDENLQSYDLAAEETWECEFQFRYD